MSPRIFLVIATASLLLAGCRAGKTDKEEVKTWFIEVASSLGMSEDGAMQLLDVLKKYEPADHTELPTVEEMDDIAAKLKPQVLADARPLMCENDYGKVEAMMNEIHQAAIEYIKSQNQ